MSEITSTQQLENILVKSLNTYCFQNIWNESPSEFRVNIIPDVVDKSSSSGNIFVNSRTVPLPTKNESYYIFSVASSVAYGLNNKLLKSEWISTAELCNKEDILIDVYHLSGKLFHKGYVYVYPLPDRTGYLIAINKQMANSVEPYEKLLVKNKVVAKDNFTILDTFLNTEIEEEADTLSENQNIDNLEAGFYIHTKDTEVLGDVPFTHDYQYNLTVALDKTQYAITYINGEAISLSRKLQTVLIHNPDTGESHYEQIYTKWENYYNKFQISESGVEFYSYLPMIRVSIYYDPDITNKINIMSHKLSLRDYNGTSKEKFIEFVQKCNNNRDHLTIIKNGYETYLKDSSIFEENTYIDIIHDDNTVFTYDINISDPVHNLVYFSEKDKIYKQLIHFPKELNPNNEIFTHDSMHIYVRNNVENKGVLYHRCAKDSVTQVTHNDISLPTYVLDAFRDHLNEQNISLHIVIRRHDKNNVLVREKSYIDLLYSLDDTTIIDHLLGKIEPESLHFWKANELESTKYVEMMFDVPNIITTSNMYDYVEGLGYYQVASLLCKKIQSSTITNLFDRVIYYPKPYVYQANKVYPLVYINGYKINNNLVDYINNNTNIEVKLDNKVKYEVGDTLSTQLFIHGDTSIYGFIPNEKDQFIDLPYSDYTILEEVNLDIELSNFNNTFTYKKYYRKFTETLGNIVKVPSDKEGFTRLSFGPLVYGKKFIIQNNVRVYSYNFNLDDDLLNSKPLIYSLNRTTTSYEQVPVYYTPQVICYLNGKYLIKDLDFTFVEIKDPDGHLLDKLLVIQNVSYLKNSGNTLEVFITSEEVENIVNHHVVNDLAYDSDELSLLFENMTTIHVNGILETKYINKGNYIELPSGKYKQGAPFESCTTIPKVIKAFIDRHHPNDDLERLEILNKYFYGKRPSYPDKVIIEKSYSIYSVFTAAIVKDILEDRNTVSIDPDTDRMLNQLSSYQHYKNVDVIFNEDIDLRFVDTYPHYKQFTTDSTEKYKLITAIISKLLPEDDNSNYEIYH